MRDQEVGVVDASVGRRDKLPAVHRSSQIYTNVALPSAAAPGHPSAAAVSHDAACTLPAVPLLLVWSDTDSDGSVVSRRSPERALSPFCCFARSSISSCVGGAAQQRPDALSRISGPVGYGAAGGGR